MVFDRLRRLVWFFGLLFGASAITNAFLTYQQFIMASKIERLDVQLATSKTELEVRQAFMTDLIAFSMSRPAVQEVLKKYNVPIQVSPQDSKR